MNPSRTRPTSLRALAALAAMGSALGCEGIIGDPSAGLQRGAHAELPAQAAGREGEPGEPAEETYAPEQAVRLDEGPSFEGAASPACDLAITQVAAYQAVKRTLWREGEIVAGHTRLIAGKATLFRIFVTPGPRWPNRLAKARLTLTEPGGSIRTYEVERLMAGVSSDAVATSTFNFVINAPELSTQTRYRAELDLGSDCKRVEPSRRVPREGPLPVGAVEVAPLRIVIVPFIYNTDGSGRLPAVGEQQLEHIRSALTAMLPVRDLDIRVRQAIATQVVLNDDTFALLLDQVRALRAADQADNDVHYMGLVAPTAALSQYCQGTCTAGLAFGNAADDPALRVGVAIGYAGEDSVRAFVHELGHTLGLRHAPCNTSDGVDPLFPHAGGLVGVWGFDERSRLLHDPGAVPDFMGYCSHPWISDYSYSRIQTRMRSFMPAGSALTVGVFSQEPFVSVYVAADGRVVASQRPVETFVLPRTRLLVRHQTPAGEELVEVYPLPTQDAPGRLWLMPARLVDAPGVLHLPGVQPLALPLPN